MFLGYSLRVGLKRSWLKGVRGELVLYQYSILNSQEFVILKNPLQIFHVSHLPGFWPVMNLREVQAFGPRGRERDYDGPGSIIHPCRVPRLTSFQTLFE